MSDPDDGLAPMRWQDYVGPCLVARVDRKPLDSSAFTAIVAYFVSETIPIYLLGLIGVLGS
jgi:hypothetical protein